MKGFTQNPQWKVQLRTLLYSKDFIWILSRGSYWKPFCILRALSRTHPWGSNENPFVFEVFYLDTTQGLLLSTPLYCKALIQNPPKGLYWEPFYISRALSRTQEGDSTKNHLMLWYKEPLSKNSRILTIREEPFHPQNFKFPVFIWNNSTLSQSYIIYDKQIVQ